MRQSRVIETSRQMLGVAAVPLIEPDDVPPCGPRLVGYAGDVVGQTGPFQSVQQQERGMSLTLRVPVTVRQHARIGGDIEVPLDRCRQLVKPARLRPRVKRLQMTARKSRLVLAGLELH